jgi:hypothetical protein
LLDIIDQVDSTNMKVRFSDRIYVDCLSSRIIPMHSSVTILILLSIVTLIITSTAGISTPLVFAAASAHNFSTNNTTIKNTNSNPLTSNEHTPNGSNHVILKAVGIGKNNATNQPQMITNISRKGIYKVQLQWHTQIASQSSLVPKSGFGLEVRFVNGTAQSATSKNIPNKHAESGVTTLGVGTQYRVPGSIVRLMPVSSYDMTIYDNHGNVLWSKANQYVSAGVGLAQVVLPNGYRG